MASSLTGETISSEAPETSRLRYLIWPIVKLMTLLRFWRKPKDDESDEDLDTTHDCDFNVDKSTVKKGIGRFYNHFLYICDFIYSRIT